MHTSQPSLILSSSIPSILTPVYPFPTIPLGKVSVVSQSPYRKERYGSCSVANMDTSLGV